MAVVSLIEDLLYSQRDVIKPEEVGVVAATRKQVQKIRQLLRMKNAKKNGCPDLSKVQVASTEEFHGHEVKVCCFVHYFVLLVTFSTHKNENQLT
jgi:superfamily I DNA and/or RNA helicase